MEAQGVYGIRKTNATRYIARNDSGVFFVCNSQANERYSDVVSDAKAFIFCQYI